MADKEVLEQMLIDAPIRSFKTFILCVICEIRVPKEITLYNE